MGHLKLLNIDVNQQDKSKMSWEALSCLQLPVY